MANPRLNAVIATDPDRALAAAAASDVRRAAGQLRSTLDGRPILIKDNIEAVGLPATAGSRALSSSAPDTDSPLVERLRAAGLIVIGASNLSEWANFRSVRSTSGWSAIGGQTRNPYDVGINPSGSSSGSAAAVAAGLVELSIGTETEGSIVSPAGYCGVVGFKPSRGSVPGAGIVPISARQDIAGPITATVADAAALFAILSGRASTAFGDPASSDPTSVLAGRSIGWWAPSVAAAAELTVFAQVEQRLLAAGIDLRPVAADAVSPFEGDLFNALVTEFAVELPAYLARRPGPHPRTWAELLAFNRADGIELSLFGDDIFVRAAEAPPIDDPAYRAARTRTDDGARATMDRLLAEADVAITLTNPPAGSLDYEHGDAPGLSTSSPAAVTGAPSLSLPAGLVDGRPVGISLIGRPGHDDEVLSVAAAIEALLPPIPPPP